MNNLSCNKLGRTFNAEPLNVKQFFSFFIFRQTFRGFAVPGHPKYVTLNSLKKGLEALTLRLSTQNTVKSKELSSSGSSAVALYNYEAAFLRAIKEESLLLRKKLLLK